MYNVLVYNVYNLIGTGGEADGGEGDVAVKGKYQHRNVIL